MYISMKSQSCCECRMLRTRTADEAAANAMWALVQLQRPQRLPEITARDIGELQPQEWANCSSPGFGQWQSEAMMTCSTCFSACFLTEENSQGVWALATGGIHDEQFFRKAKEWLVPDQTQTYQTAQQVGFCFNFLKVQSSSAFIETLLNFHKISM